MSELVSLGLETADGRPLIHKFYKQPEAAEGLLVVFPGNHYGVDGPLLYYPCELLRDHGWDTLAISYGFQTAGREPFEEGLDVLLAECRTAASAALGVRDYPRVGLAGKSLGAAVVAQLCATGPEFSMARAGYLTPALGTPFFDPLFIETMQPAYVAVGTADRFYSQEAVESLRSQKHFELDLIEGADHSMNVPGDLTASTESLRKVVEQLIRFLQDGT
ncbi:MAG: alpha/beta family hydrolase [Anaerolineales bacterium]